MRSICLSFAILMGSAFGAYAQQVTSYPPQVGGTGGGPFDDACHGSDVLVGFNYTAGKAMNTIAAVCQPQASGILTGTNYGLNTWGKLPDDVGAKGAPRCPGGQAIIEFHILVDKNNEINRISATCRPMLPPNPASSETQLPVTAAPGGQSVRDGSSQCEFPAIGIGITGRSGQLVDSLGIKCSTFPWQVAVVPPPVIPPNPTPTPTPPQQLVTVLLDDDVYKSSDLTDANKFPNLILQKGTEKTESVVFIETDATGTRFHLHWKECDQLLPTGCWVYSAPDYQALKLQ
jgi:hypothetical protein